MNVILANPRGFCAGVDRAIEIVERAIEMFDPPIYVRHEVVHNKTVVAELMSKGAIFVDELDEVPDDAIVVFSAHGVSKEVRERGRAARASGVRRDVPAGDQGPHGGDPAPAQGSGMRPHRSRAAIPKSKGPSASSRGTGQGASISSNWHKTFRRSKSKIPIGSCT